MPNPTAGTAPGQSSTVHTVNERAAVNEKAAVVAVARFAVGVAEPNAEMFVPQSCFCWQTSQCTDTRSCRQ
jgi:hypothetical protein